MPQVPDGEGPVNREEARARFEAHLKIERHKPKLGPAGEPDARDKHTRDNDLDDPAHQEED